MVDEADNLVLRLLREMRATQQEMKTVQDEHTKRFDRLDRSLDDARESVTTALGLSAMANVRHEGVAREIETLIRSSRRIDDLETRVTRLEQRP